MRHHVFGNPRSDSSTGPSCTLPGSKPVLQPSHRRQARCHLWPAAWRCSAKSVLGFCWSRTNGLMTSGTQGRSTDDRRRRRRELCGGYLSTFECFVFGCIHTFFAQALPTKRRGNGQWLRDSGWRCRKRSSTGRRCALRAAV